MEKLPLNRKKPQCRSLLRLAIQRQREKELFLWLTILLLLHVIFFELWGELRTTVFGNSNIMTISHISSVPTHLYYIYIIYWSHVWWTSQTVSPNRLPPHSSFVLSVLTTQWNSVLTFFVYFDQVTNLLELNYSYKNGLDILEWLSLFAIDWGNELTNKP